MKLKSDRKNTLSFAFDLSNAKSLEGVKPFFRIGIGGPEGWLTFEGRIENERLTFDLPAMRNLLPVLMNHRAIIDVVVDEYFFEAVWEGFIEFEQLPKPRVERKEAAVEQKELEKPDVEIAEEVEPEVTEGEIEDELKQRVVNNLMKS